MKTFALIILSMLAYGCIPLLAGGAVGYAVGHERKDRQHEEWKRQERERYERARWGPYYHPGYRR